MALLLALAGAALLAGALFLWFRWLRQVALAGRRRYAWVLIALGMGLALAACLADPGPAAAALAGLTLAGGALWIGLAAQARQSRQAPAVAVGQPAPDFTAPDAHGAPFRLADLRGHPTLIKFFRGHW